MAIWDKMTLVKEEGVPNLLVMSICMTIDRNGQPSIVLSTSSWVRSFFGTCAYYVKQLFTKDKDKEKRALNRLRMFLERLQARVTLDEKGLPVFSVDIAFDPISETRKVRSMPVTDAKPIVVKRKKGTVIYNIQNITINVTAEVVNQLNMNPTEVVNHFHDQIENLVDSVVKKRFPKEDL